MTIVEITSRKSAVEITGANVGTLHRWCDPIDAKRINAITDDHARNIEGMMMFDCCTPDEAKRYAYKGRSVGVYESGFAVVDDGDDDEIKAIFDACEDAKQYLADVTES